MQHRAVTRELVVLMEHMQFERAVATPEVHRLEGDKRLSTVDGVLGQRLVLHTVRLAPQRLAAAELRKIAGVWLEQQSDIALRDQLRARTHPGHAFRQLRIGDAEILPISPFEIDAAQTSASIRSKWCGWIGKRRSFSLRVVPMTPRRSRPMPAYFLTRLRTERLGTDTVADRPMSNRSRPRSSSAAPS